MNYQENIYILFYPDRPNLKDILPIYHDIGSEFTFCGDKFRVFEITISDDNIIDEIGWSKEDFDTRPYVIWCEWVEKVDFNTINRDIKLKTLTNDDDRKNKNESNTSV